MWDYNDKVQDHFRNPRNMGEAKDYNAVGEVGSIACGDALRLTMRVNPESEKIEEVRFQTFGCGSAIAASSAMTEMIEGMTIEEAAKVTNQQIVDYLGGLPAEKMHCSVMGSEALEAAINNYKGIETEHNDEDEGKLVCTCFGITDKKIERVVRENNLHTIEEVTNYCKAGGGCQSCHAEIEDIIHVVWKDQPAVTAPAKPIEKKRRAGMTTIEKINKIQEVLDKEIRPMLAKDGGDIELVDVDGNTVYVALRGMCSSCPSAQFTLKLGVEDKLKEFVSPDLVVEEA